MSYKVEIFDQVLKRDKDGNVISKFAILRCLDTDTLNQAIAKYVSDVPHNQFVDISIPRYSHITASHRRPHVAPSTQDYLSSSPS